LNVDLMLSVSIRRTFDRYKTLGMRCPSEALLCMGF
jgi:hypothetical protein